VRHPALPRPDCESPAFTVLVDHVQTSAQVAQVSSSRKHRVSLLQSRSPFGAGGLAHLCVRYPSDVLRSFHAVVKQWPAATTPPFQAVSMLNLCQSTPTHRARAPTQAHYPLRLHVTAPWGTLGCGCNSQAGREVASFLPVVTSILSLPVNTWRPSIPGSASTDTLHEAHHSSGDTRSARAGTSAGEEGSTSSQRAPLSLPSLCTQMRMRQRHWLGHQ
jgi:hypothetical protein